MISSPLKQISGLFFFFFLIGIFTSCESEQRDPFDPNELPETISFATDVVATFSESCSSTSCHGGSTPPDLSPENAYFDLINGNYLDVENPSNSALYKKIIGTASMATHSNDRQRALILKWIEQGALEN